MMLGTQVTPVCELKLTARYYEIEVTLNPYPLIHGLFIYSGDRLQ